MILCNHLHLLVTIILLPCKGSHHRCSQLPEIRGFRVSRVRRSILIKAPGEKVFAYVNDPHNLLDIWPRLVSIDRTWAATQGGLNFDWSYKWMGRRLKGVAQVAEWLPGQRLALSVKSELEVECIFDFEPVGGSVQVNLEMAFAVPTPTIKTLVETVALSIQSHELEIVLTNLKMRMEWDWHIPQTYAIINPLDEGASTTLPPPTVGRLSQEEQADDHLA